MTACVSIPTFRRPKSRQKGSAHGTGQSVSPFVQELPSAISFSRLNLVTNNFSSFARGETVRPPLEMSDTKSFTFFLAKDGYWLCPLRCRMFLMLPLPQYPIAKVPFWAPKRKDSESSALKYCNQRLRVKLTVSISQAVTLLLCYRKNIRWVNAQE